MLYYAEASSEEVDGGIQITGSHNPPNYNGFKMVHAHAPFFGADIQTIGALAAAGDWEAGVGTVRDHDIFDQYVTRLTEGFTGGAFRIGWDAGNGAAGPALELLVRKLPGEHHLLFTQVDGTFPNHEANPLEPANLVDLQKAVAAHRADLGLAFDGDADRCFVVDERGEAVTPSAVAAIVAAREISRAQAIDPGAEIVVIHNLITSNIVPETIRALGATPVRTKVGHSLIKDQMAATGAVFGGEHSAHYYFKNFWGADNGMLAAMHVLAEFGSQSEPLSTLTAKYSPYALSGEINSTVSDVTAATARVRSAFEDRGTIDGLDGLTITGSVAEGEAFWWFSVRPSNTEPLLRLNVEAADESTMARVRDEVLALIRA